MQATAPQQEVNLPHNEEMERMILGSLLLEQKPEYFFEIADKLRASDFFSGANRVIFESLTRLAMRGDDLALSTLIDDLIRTDNLERLGGRAYIALLTDGVPRRLRIETEVRRVRDLAAKRWLMRLGQRLIERAEDDDETAEHLFEVAEKALADARTGQIQVDAISSADAIERWKRETVARWDDTADQVGVKTGYPALDSILHGLRPSRLHLLAARPSEGKTCFALNIAHNATKLRRNAKPVILMVSLEMDTDELMDRAVATAARIDSDRLLEGRLSDEERQDVFAAADEISDLDVHYLDPSSRLLVDGIRSTARRVKMQRGRLDLIVIDYLQLLSSSNPRDAEYERLSEISRGLKLLSRNERLPILALSQLNREIEKRHGANGSRKPEPQMSDLRGSGSLEQDADVVMFLHNPYEDDESVERQLLIKKQRGGRKGVVNLLWHKSQSRFASPREC